MAMSALLMSSSAYTSPVSPGAATTTPMLVVTTASWPSTWKGALKSCLILAATSAAWPKSSRPSSSMANSSPPKRERVAEAQAARYALGHPHQELVAYGVAQRVVEALEVVQVHV